MRAFVISTFLLFITACTLIPSTPLPPVSADLGSEFELAPGQIATINGTDLKITLLGVPGDQRCPLEIECAISGPVSATISIQFSSETPQEVSFLTFTDNDGSVPQMDFEGMTTSVGQNGYLVQIKSITPFPQKRIGEINAEEYRVRLVVTKGEN